VRSDAATRDPDHPSNRIDLRLIEALAIAKRPRKRLARHVLRIRTVANPIRHVGVQVGQELHVTSATCRSARKYPYLLALLLLEMGD
jgi:hypothetical protein